MHAVAPFYLQTVKQQVKQAVAAENEKDRAALPAASSQGRREKKTKEEAGLGRAVKTQIVGIKAVERQQSFEENPRQIGDNTGNENKEQAVFAEHGTAEWRLKGYMAECIRQEMREVGKVEETATKKKFI